MLIKTIKLSLLTHTEGAIFHIASPTYTVITTNGVLTVGIGKAERILCLTALIDVYMGGRKNEQVTTTYTCNKETVETVMYKIFRAKCTLKSLMCKNCHIQHKCTFESLMCKNYHIQHKMHIREFDVQKLPYIAQNTHSRV